MDNLKYIESIQDFICFNQKKLIEYNYILALKHKEMKNFFIDKIKNKEYTQSDMKILTQKYDSLVETAFDQIITIFQKNNNKINNIFEALGKTSFPRVVVKSILSDYVLDLYRKENVGKFRLSKINENSAFSAIINNEEELYCKQKYKIL